MVAASELCCLSDNSGLNGTTMQDELPLCSLKLHVHVCLLLQITLLGK